MAENGTRRATFHTDDPRYDISVTIENVSFSNESADNVDFVINAKFEGSENVKKINTTNLNNKFKIVNLNVEEKRFDISGTGKYEEVDLCLEFHLTNGNKCNYNIPIDIENFGNKNELVIKGARPEFYAIPERRPLKGYKIPKSFLNALRDLIKKYPEFTERMPNLRKLLERGFKIKNDASLSDLQTAFFKKCANILKIPTKLNANHYCSMLEKLLYIEENQMKIDIRYYDRPGSHFQDRAIITYKRQQVNRANRQTSYIYQMEVEGLSEGRPSLLKNDSVFVRYGKEKKYKFEGIVHTTRQNFVELGFHKMFEKVHVNLATNQRFSVEFGFNRRPVRVQHQAVELAKTHKVVPYFFPNSKTAALGSSSKENLNFFNKHLNEEQKRAVCNILKIKSVPYLIFGPPGTGKTVTVVETILQIWKNQPESRLLVTTPSNAAADVIMIRLQNIIPKMYMFRLCGHNYGEASKIIADFGEDITNLKNGRPYMPEMNKLSSKRVIIATLVTATRLVNGKFPCGHFSHVFMDEGGYATETESLLPAVGIMTDESKPGKVCGQFVISGDPRQLGPRIHSNFNKFCGLGTSMLERLIDTCDIYARDETKSVPYDERCITKLLVNYRSHEEILRVPNELFYDGELKPASDNLSQLFVDWEELPKQGFPVIFHNVNGEDKQDKSSPSFFNEAEVKIVTKYVEKLLKDTKVKGMTIKDEQIGVITPYRRQAEKIKNECGKMQYKKVNIGTVQVFQGKENIVTIISTVRSKNAASHEKDDELYDLGLLNSPKRFNVALTRAKSLLIVVGNADVLKVDRYWRKFLQHCIANNAIKGNAIELSDDDILTDNGIFAGEDDGPDFNDGQF